MPNAPEALATNLRDFRVVGPNLSDGRPTSWYFHTLDAARAFAEVMANAVDAPYEILQHVGTLRQVPLPPRPLEWIPAGKPET